MAWKPLCQPTCAIPKEEAGQAWTRVYQLKKREEFECNLLFLGLVVLDNPIKLESEPTIKELLSANFRVIMATGELHP